MGVLSGCHGFLVPLLNRMSTRGSREDDRRRSRSRGRQREEEFGKAQYMPAVPGMPAIPGLAPVMAPGMVMMPSMPVLSPDQMPTFKQLHQQMNSSHTGSILKTDKKSDEEEDPLDAYMSGIEKEVEAKNKKQAKKAKGPSLEDIKNARESFGPHAFARLRPQGWSERLGPDSMLEDKGTR